MYSLLMISRRTSGGGVTVAVTGSLVAAGAVVTNAGACWRDSWMMSQWYSQTGTPTATAEAKANSEASSFCMLSDVIRRKTYMLRTLVICLLYTSDAADDLLCVDLGGRRIIK